MEENHALLLILQQKPFLSFSLELHIVRKKMNNLVTKADMLESALP